MTNLLMENLFTQEELDIDFATCVNMFDGMDHDTAQKEAIKDYKEYNRSKKDF